MRPRIDTAWRSPALAKAFPSSWVEAMAVVSTDITWSGWLWCFSSAFTYSGFTWINRDSDGGFLQFRAVPRGGDGDILQLCLLTGQRRCVLRLRPGSAAHRERCSVPSHNLNPA
jgi:hypothetical protein